MDKTDFLKIRDYVFKENSASEVILRGTRNCTTYGIINITDLNHCGDTNCTSCNYFQKVIREVAQKELDKIKKL